MKPTKIKELTPKEQLFIKFYIVSYNGADAVRKAGYTHKQPARQAWALLKKPHIQKALQKHTKQLEKKIEGTQEEAINMCRKIALIDVNDYEKKRTSRGIELYGKTHGIFIERTDNIHRLGESEMAMAARIAREELANGNDIVVDIGDNQLLESDNNAPEQDV